MKVSCVVGAIALFVSLTCTRLVSGAKPKIGNVRGGVVPSDDADSGGSDAVNGIAEEVQDDAAASAQHRRLGLKNKSDRKWMTQDKGKGVGRPKDNPDKGNGNGKGDNDSEEKDYIVTFQGMKTLGKGLTKCVDVAKGHKGTVKKNFSKVLDGCVMRLNRKELESIRNNPNIQFVEEDQEVYLSEDYSWGLDRINQPSLPLDKQITKKDANGVTVYIIDTGIMESHEDFDGVLDPASSCHKYVHDDGDGPLTDRHGHGTHVASTACGVTYGVASNCRLCAVRVFNKSGGAFYSNVIDGIEHAVADCDGSTKCVINMSLGGGKSVSLNDAVASAVDKGVHVVVAAGNENTDACNSSPASEPKAITVGSTTEEDTRSGFSNYGECVDIFAPGSVIKAAYKSSSNSYVEMSGTSMASPHVAGIAAFIAGTGSFTPAQLTAQMKAMAVTGVVKDSRTCHSDLASVNNGGPPTTPPPSGHYLEVNILTDRYPGETSWSIVNKWTGKEIKSVNGYGIRNNLYTWESGFINQGKYEFTIKDSWGDGICCAYGRGSFSVSYDGHNVASGGNFGRSFTTALGSCDPVSPSPTRNPTNKPTGTPTSPTPKPTENPTSSPTKSPTSNPTESPTSQPTSNPTHSPTGSPTNNPTESPISDPTESPTSQPTSNPTRSPTESPTNNLTESPTSKPTESPTSQPTSNPTHSPTESPTNNPTESPTSNPTESPTSHPTANPTHSPTKSPTNNPTESPTNNPTESPTSKPTESPTSQPTSNPTHSPTKSPTNNPTESPTNNPTESPTSNPTESPTHSAAYKLGYSAGFADGFAEAAAGQE